MNTPNQGYVMPAETVFERRMDQVQEDVRDMRTAITNMANALSKLAVLEERNISVAQEVTRANAKIAVQDARITAMELVQAKFDGKVDGATNTIKIIWAVGGCAVAYVLLPLIKVAFGAP